ncbi:MAG TPA: hypothetical protein VFX49_10220 [Chloroflexota bacterium]|nr:hypothetical protein [Chloroflexota bacterium]
MPKKYEDEIREILKGLDDVPGDGQRAAAGTGGGPGRRPGGPSRPIFRRPSLSLNPQRVMGLALILILFAWIMQGPWSRGFPDVFRMAGYISLAGTVLFVVGLIGMLRAGGRLGGFGSGQQRWRGQVIYLPNRQPFWVRWRHSVARLFRSARSQPGSKSGPRRGGGDSDRW